MKSLDRLERDTGAYEKKERVSARQTKSDLAAFRKQPALRL